MTEEENLETHSTFFIKCLSLVETLIAVGDVKQSIEIIEALLQANPNHTELHKKKAMALIKENRFEDALKSLDFCIRNAKNHEKSQCLLFKADLLYSLEKYPKSLRIYEFLLRYNPDRSEILYRKGLCLLANQKFKQATQIFHKVLFLNPDYSQCYIMNGHSLFMQKKYQKAIWSFSRVTQKHDFQNTDALYLKASCHYNLGQYDLCRKELNRVLEIYFGHVESKVLLAIVKSKIIESQRPRRIRRLRQNTMHN